MQWRKAFYMQAVQLVLHTSWWSKETHCEEALLHRPHWLNSQMGGEQLCKAGCSIDSPYSPHCCQIQLPSDENSAILCGIMDDSCCSRQIPFFCTFSRRTLSAPALSWAWSFTILLKLYFLNSVQYRQLCCLSQLYSKMSWIEYGCTPKAEVLYSVKCNALYFELWPSAANFGFHDKESEEKILLASSPSRHDLGVQISCIKPKYLEYMNCLQKTRKFSF